MASMWRRAMVYLGLQDDDELEYGGEYESYGDYGEPAEEPPNPRRAATRVGTTPTVARRARESGTVRTRPEPADRLRGRLRRARAGARACPGPTAPREEPSGMSSSPRPSVVRTIGPTTAARVHVVEPQGFNDAQEVGDRLKANQPVILNLQGLPPRAAAAADRLLERPRLRGGGTMQRVADQVFLLTPSNVEVSQEEKERLQARGLFQP